MRDEHIVALLPSILSTNASQTLKVLDIAENDITDFGGVRLVEALPFIFLTGLCMENCKIGDGTAAALAKVLEDPRSKIEELFLASNQISKNGTHMIFSALEHNSKVHSVDLSKNRIKNSGTKVLSRVIKKNKV